MTRRPFRPAVDTGAYFPAASHEAALTAVASAFARRDPVALIDGPPGTGKSLVARLWLERLPTDVPRVVLPSIEATKPADLLQAILFDLNQPYRGLSEQELRLAVTDQVLATAATGHPTVLLIDEAQHLGPAALEELRLLGNIETPAGSALFVLLVAQSRFREALAQHGVESLAQRVGARCRVEPLTADEAAAYLRHQVAAAGGKPTELFDDEAIGLIVAACGGVPRVLNRIACLAAELTACAGAETIDAEAAIEVIGALGLHAPEPGEAEELVTLPHPGQAPRPTRAKVRTSRTAADRDEPPTAEGSKKATRKRSA
jgi:type II secretory pathway predicted ATPase ExeA